MAAIDPSAEPEFSGSAIDGSTPRATLKLIRQPISSGDYSDDDDDDDDDDEESEEDVRLKALLNGDISDESSSGDEEVNGGPSDPSKSKKARREAALESLKNALETQGSDEEMSVDGAEGVKLNKGKGVATGEEDDSSEGDSEDVEVEEFVLCTLDPVQACQIARISSHTID